MVKNFQAWAQDQQAVQPAEEQPKENAPAQEQEREFIPSGVKPVHLPMLDL